VKVGDRVLFNPEDQLEVEVQGTTYLVMRERDLHAVATELTEHGTGLYL
jgi:chaperonin GroES